MGLNIYMVFQSVKMRSTRSQAVRPSGDDALRELFTEVEKGAVKSKRVSRVAGPSEIVVGEPCVVSSSVVTPRDGTKFVVDQSAVFPHAPRGSIALPVECRHPGEWGISCCKGSWTEITSPQREEDTCYLQ